MMPEWDYSHAKSKGKNIFFLRDTNHTSDEVQESILGELERLVGQHFFSTLFTEGFEGVYRPCLVNCPSEEELKRALRERQGRLSPISIFAYRHQAALNLGHPSIYGVDSISLIDEQARDLQRVFELRDKIVRGEGLTPKEIVEYRWRNDVNQKRISDERSTFSVAKVAELMRSVDTAGLIYGNGHFPLMAAGLEKAGIGYVSYFPGDVDVDPERMRDYVRKL